jgi:ABC-type antimicrobial peptide transport system permease subunit
VLGAAMAMGVFHSAWSLGLATAGIIAGIVAVTSAINSAKDNIEEPKIPDFNASDYNVTSGNYNIPQNQGNYGSYTDNTSSYVDNSNVVINIEKNEYMTEDDIIRAVNKGLKQAKQSRT